MKMIKVSDGLHERLKDLSVSDGLTIGSVIESRFDGVATRGEDLSRMADQLQMMFDLLVQVDEKVSGDREYGING